MVARAAIYAMERPNGFNLDYYNGCISMFYRTDTGLIDTADEWGGFWWACVGQAFLLDALWNDFDERGHGWIRDRAVDALIDATDSAYSLYRNNHGPQSDYANQFFRLLANYPGALLLKDEPAWALRP